MPSLALYRKRDSDCHPAEGGPNYACADHFPQENLVPRNKCFEEFGPGGPFSWGDQNRRDRTTTGESTGWAEGCGRGKLDEWNFHAQ